MTLTLTLTPSQRAKLEAIAARRRTTLAHLVQSEAIAVYIAVLAQETHAAATSSPARSPRVTDGAPPRALRGIRGGKP